MGTVIKVKFGDTLRRIYVEELDFDMAVLREKICALFGLNLDADFTLTYIDEDGDVVTLCNNEDLDDLEAQSLYPIRMTVRLNPDNHAKSYVTSSENSTSEDQLPIQSLNSAVSVILKFVPERRHEALLKLLVDVAWENMNMKDQQPLKIVEASETLGGEDGSPDSKKEALQLETVKKDGILADIDLNVPYSDSETVLNEIDVKGSGESLDFGTCVDFNECPFIGMPLTNAHSSGCLCYDCKLKDDLESCYLILEDSGHDAADYFGMDIPSACTRNGSPVSVCNDQKDPEMVNPEMDEKSEVCENKSMGIVESEDQFFDAQPHPSKLTCVQSTGSNQDQGIS